jgi:hypothetical protein
LASDFDIRVSGGTNLTPGCYQAEENVSHLIHISACGLIFVLNIFCRSPHCGNRLIGRVGLSVKGAHLMSRSVLYAAIGVLAIAAGVFGYQLYEERQRTTGVEISIGERGISIEKK